MSKFTPFVAIITALAVQTAIATADAPPLWAYPVNPPSEKPPADKGGVKHVPNSTVALTSAQIAALDGEVPDWHPDEHPPMPVIVSRGRAPQVYACAYCHLPTGAGRPENASLAGLTPAYVKQQMQSFRVGDRLGSEPARLPQALMIALAKSTTETEIAEAAAYFASLKPASFVRVVETSFVPKTVTAGWTLTSAQDGGTEPIGNRIIEMPEDFDRFELRDSRTSYVAYVPVGSIVRGARLIATGGGGKVKCATCHGPELRGLTNAPRLTGRSPSYLFRQLHDFRNGTRKGATAALMKQIVANLTDEDLVALAANLASRKP